MNFALFLVALFALHTVALENNSQTADNKDIPMHSSGVGNKLSLRSLPNQDIL